MNNYSLREVVEMALQTEKLGYKFYTQMAERFAHDLELKALMERLAEAETVHEHTFAKMLDKVDTMQLEGWDEAQPYFRAVMESEFFLGRDKALPNLDHVNNVMEALDFAIKFEKETAMFFVGMKTSVLDSGVIDDIIKEEASHIQWLTKYKEALKS
jgi:rubrerythrin